MPHKAVAKTLSHLFPIFDLFLHLHIYKIWCLGVCVSSYLVTTRYEEMQTPRHQTPANLKLCSKKGFYLWLIYDLICEYTF